MKKTILFITLLLTIFQLGFSQEEQPDYTKIKFRKKVKKYKKSTPKIEGTGINKDFIVKVVNLLGETHYSAPEREEIVEKIWLSFTDPKKFDMVHRDYAIRSLPNWNKKNFKGEIVLEPNIYLKEWTVADTELDYFKVAMHRILMHEGLMGYGEEAKDVRKSLKKVKYISKYKLPQPTSKDWTNSYLKKLGSAVSSKNLSVLVTSGGHEFVVCDKAKKDLLVSLLSKLKWDVIVP